MQICFISQHVTLLLIPNCQAGGNFRSDQINQASYVIGFSVPKSHEREAGSLHYGES
jgi:hypothetical protein